eukprot:5859178-Alexandrium_andersonii.AAC.1
MAVRARLSERVALLAGLRSPVLARLRLRHGDGHSDHPAGQEIWRDEEVHPGLGLRVPPRPCCSWVAADPH